MFKVTSSKDYLDHITTTGKVNTTPLLKDLYLHITPQHVAKWKVIGEQLDIRTAQLDAIEAEYPTNVKYCCNKMFEKWLEVNTSASWKMLLNVIESPKVYSHEGVDKGAVTDDATTTVKQLKARTLTKLKGKYSNIVIKVQSIIKKGSFHIKELITSLCNVDDENITIFSSDKAFSEITDIDSLFHRIGTYCNMYDFDLLLAFVEFTECEEAIKLLDNFTEELRQSILRDLDLLSEGEELLNPKDFMPDTHKLVIKYVGGGKCTLIAKEKIQNIIYECFHLRKGSITFKGVQEGCFAFVYQISAVVKCHMLQREITHSDITTLAENHITYISIDDVKLKISTQLNELQEKHNHSQPPSTKQPAISTQGLTMEWLSGQMKERYLRKKYNGVSKNEEHWPPIKTKSYVTLAIIHQEEVQMRQETIAIIHLRAKGKIDNIVSTFGTKKLKDLTEMFDLVSGSILIEGHAGIGKTTLAKEICLEWAEGRLLNSEKLVLLLFLRDPNVQKITNELKLLQYFTSYHTADSKMHKELLENYGAGVTLIIDGFDELKSELRQESFFRSLIANEVLPQAKIVVTSRPSASLCLHNSVHSRIEILGFEQSSKDQYVNEALKDYPSNLQKLQSHFKLHPNIDAICYIPLIMSIIVYLCKHQPNNLPETATKMYDSFIQHTICHYLKRKGENIPKDKIIKVQESLSLQQLQQVAFNGLLKDKMVFTIEELPEKCKDDATFYGLLQCSEYYSEEHVGTLTQSFNFIHMGIQEYFAAKHVKTLPEDEVCKLLKESFIVTDNHKSDSKSVRLSNMWILYCGLTNGQCKILRHHLETYNKSNHDRPLTDAQMTLEKNGSSQQKPNHGISLQILNDPVKVLYLFQCFHEAQDSKLCEILLNLFDKDIIDISDHKLLPHQAMSLGFFLAKLDKKWKELNLSGCHIEYHGMSILNQFLFGDKFRQQEIEKIVLSDNSLTGTSSCHIGDIITHLQPYILELNQNSITNVMDISTAITKSTVNCKVLNMEQNFLVEEEAPAISAMIMFLEKLYIGTNKLGDKGCTCISEGIATTNTLKVLSITNNSTTSLGTKDIANALAQNTSLEELYMEDNEIGQDGAKAIAKAITINKTLKTLSLDDDTLDIQSLMIIMKVLKINVTLIVLKLPYTQLYYDYNVKEKVIKINMKRNILNVQELRLRRY